MATRSLNQQIDHALHSICRFGESRFDAKVAGTAHEGIFSHKSLETHKGVLHPMASYCKEHYGLRQISDLKPEMVRSYLDHKQAEGCSVKTLEGIRTACQKLEHGVVKAYHTSERVFFPRDYKIAAFRPEDTVKIARHEPQDARAMVAWAKENLSEKVGFALETAKDMGLRSGELAQVRCCAVRLDGLTGKDIGELNSTNLKAHDKAVYREIGKGPCVYLHGSLDGAKGDRHRVVEIPQHLVPSFRQALQGRQTTQERVLGVSQRTIQSWENQARTATGSTGKAVHGLRRTYVKETIDRGLAEGKSFDQIVDRLSKELGHSREQILAWYFGR